MNEKVKTSDKVLFVFDIVFAVLYILSHIMQWVGFGLIPSALGSGNGMEIEDLIMDHPMLIFPFMIAAASFLSRIFINIAIIVLLIISLVRKSAFKAAKMLWLFICYIVVAVITCVETIISVFFGAVAIFWFLIFDIIGFF